MDDQVPKEVVQERYERLVALQDEISWEENKALVGRTLEVLVAEGEGRKDGATHRLSGRAPDNRLVHFAPPDGRASRGRATWSTVEVTYAAPHHLVADGPLRSVRRTRAGDAWADSAPGRHPPAHPRRPPRHAPGRSPPLVVAQGGLAPFLSVVSPTHRTSDEQLRVRRRADQGRRLPLQGPAP